jgi:RimJ/RimL family protein N-acetyltransferase
VDQYEVETLNAVLKATNRPSQRLLERMGFVIAPVALHEAYGVGSDELLMLRNALVS